jgi:clan AA aspartic protease
MRYDAAMGVFTVTIQAGDSRGERFIPVDVLVDTGASYTTLPEEMLRDLGVRPIGKQRFMLACGQTMTKDLGETKVRLGDKERTTVVVFGDAGMTPLLGAVTLEQMGLGVDPMAQRLIEVDGYMM